MSAFPPAYLVLDLWQALGGDPIDFWVNEHGTTETWYQLLHIVRQRSGVKVCGKPLDDGSGERCVLQQHSDIATCHGPSDVGRDVLPPIPELHIGEVVDPQSVEVGWVVSVEANDGTWAIRGKVTGIHDDTVQIDLLGGQSVFYRPAANNATVRVVTRPEPDPAEQEIQALVLALDESDTNDPDTTWEPIARALHARGVRVVETGEQ